MEITDNHIAFGLLVINETLLLGQPGYLCMVLPSCCHIRCMDSSVKGQKDPNHGKGSCHGVSRGRGWRQTWMSCMVRHDHKSLHVCCNISDVQFDHIRQRTASSCHISRCVIRIECLRGWISFFSNLVDIHVVSASVFFPEHFGFFSRLLRQ